MRYGYMRVSTDMQVTDMQEDALVGAGVSPENIYRDVISGKTTSREGLDDLLHRLKDGDELVVWKLDRLGRSLDHIKKTLEDLDGRGVKFVSLRESIDTKSAVGKLMFHLLASMAEFERDMTSERVVSGMEAARGRGSKMGRIPKLSHKYYYILDRWNDGLGMREIARLAGVSHGCVQKVLAGWEMPDLGKMVHAAAEGDGGEGCIEEGDGVFGGYGWMNIWRKDAGGMVPVLNNVIAAYRAGKEYREKRVVMSCGNKRCSNPGHVV